MALAVVIVVLAVVSFHFGKEAAKRKEAAEAAKESNLPRPGAFAPEFPGELPSRHASPPPPPPLPTPLTPTEDSNVNASSQLDLPFTDPTGRYDIRIRRVLVGDDCWYKNVISEEELTEIHDQNKEAIYFEVTLKNIAVDRGIRVTSRDFFLNDDAGQWYRSEIRSEPVRGDLDVGRKAQVGALFRMYFGNYPVRLLYRTGLISASTGEEIYAYADRLETLEALNRLTPFYADSRVPGEERPLEEGEAGKEKKVAGEIGSADALPDGFRGIGWGTGIDAVDGLVPDPGRDVGYRELKAYRQAADETFYFDTIELKDSRYFSNSAVLVAGTAAVKCADEQIVLKILRERYGPGSDLSGKAEAPSFLRWKGKDTNLEYHHWEGACHLFFKSAAFWNTLAKPPPPPAKDENPGEDEAEPVQLE